MLAYILAVAVAIGSLALYIAAFFFPEIHRKNDFVWSGVGLFYALILWVCAGRITGAVLLGQTASVALLGWLGWQTVTLRRRITPEGLKTPIPPAVEKRVNQVLPSPSPTIPAAVESPVQLEKSPVVTPSETTAVSKPQTTTAVNTTPSEVIEEVTEAAEELIEEATDKAEDAAEKVEEWVETATDQVELVAEKVEDKAEDIAETVEDKVEETVAEVKAEAKTLAEARPTAKVKSKRQNPISQLLGVVTGIFGRKPKPPQPITPAEMVKTEVPEVSPTPEAEIIATAEVTPSETETVEVTENEISNTETTETIGTETEIETAEIVENEIASKSPFEELTSPTLEPQEDTEKADLIELADAIDQADSPVVKTTSPINVDVGEIEPTPATVETVEITEEPVESEVEVEVAEIVEKPTEESISTTDIKSEEVAGVEETEKTVTEAETENQSDATPPSLKRPNPPKNKRKK